MITLDVAEALAAHKQVMHPKQLMRSVCACAHAQPAAASSAHACVAQGGTHTHRRWLHALHPRSCATPCRAQALAADVLPALSQAESAPALRREAAAYRRAAATAPTRPHSWLLASAPQHSSGSGRAGVQGSAAHWAAAAKSAAGRLIKAPMQAGAVLADAAADAAHFGPRHVPAKA
jgi:hypothetical protein